jgi:hypothetical protein
MTMQRIGAEIAVTTTGGGSVREQIRNIQELSATSAQFEALRSEAADKYPEQLEKQNRYIRQQINQLQRLYSVGHAERQAELRHENLKAHTRHDKKIIQGKSSQEQTEYASYRKEIADARAAQEDWSRENGMGGFGGSMPMDAEDEYGMMLMQGMAGGGMGQATGGVLRSATRKMLGKFSGLSTMGKIGVGTGVGTIAMAAYKGIQAVGEGWSDYKQMAPALREVYSLMQTIPMAGESFRKQIEGTGVATGTMAAEMLGIEKTWMRLGGSNQINQRQQDNIGSTMLTGLAFGIDRQKSVEYTGTMARTGSQITEMDSRPLKFAIQSGMRAGFTESRLPEYLEQITSVNQAVLATSTTYDPATLLPLIENIAGLGLPFQGSRGAQVISGLNSAITNEEGVGFEAARRVADKKFGSGKYSLGQVKFLQEGGVTDPALLTEFVKISQELGGDDPWDRALMLQQMTGLKMRQIYNPYTDEQDSLLEMFEGSGRKGGKGLNFTDKEMTERIAKMDKNWAFMQEKSTAAGQYTKIEIAAQLFEAGSGIFQQAVMDFAAAVGVNNQKTYTEMIDHTPMAQTKATIARKKKHAAIKVEQDAASDKVGALSDLAGSNGFMSSGSF